jgi:hypothetical protein
LLLSIAKVSLSIGRAVGEQAEVDGPTPQAQPEQALVDLVDQREPAAALGIEALAKRGARGRLRQAQGAQREGARAQRLDGLEVALALAQQPEVASHDVVVGDAGAQREGRVDQDAEVDGLKVPPDERQTGAGAEIAGQFLDDEVGFRMLACRVRAIYD